MRPGWYCRYSIDGYLAICPLDRTRTPFNEVETRHLLSQTWRLLSHQHHLCVPARLRSAFSTARNKQLRRGRLGSQTWLSSPPDDFIFFEIFCYAGKMSVWLWAVTATAEKSALLSSAPIVMLLLYQISIAHSEHCHKKKEDLSSPRDVVLVLFFLYVSLYLSDGEAQLLLTIRTALKVQGKLESMPEGAGRDPNGGNQGMDGAKQVVLAGGMSPCSHVPNPWHRWRWSHHQGW